MIDAKAFQNLWVHRQQFKANNEKFKTTEKTHSHKPSVSDKTSKLAMRAREKMLGQSAKKADILDVLLHPTG
jgi:FKBP-type peptidyl-prolyl cis-trans isomerase